MAGPYKPVGVDDDELFAPRVETRLSNDFQAKSTALVSIAGLTLVNDDVLQVKAGAITQRTPAQLKTDLALTKGDVGLGNVDNTSNATERAATATLTNKTLTTPVITSPTGLVKGDVGLGSVDNTSDAGKPVSTAQQTALDLKANIASPTFTGTVSGITKAMVGLTNVDNTADTAKPVSTAQQSALDLKANLASPTFTGTVSGISKSMVGLGNVDNTADSAKPISTATQTALDAKADLVSGLVPTSQIPAIAITDTTVVASQAAMLALTAQKGDVAVRTDVSKTFILSTNSPTTLADWIELPQPTGAITSVNGQTGVVVLGKTDVGLGNVDNLQQQPIDPTLTALSGLTNSANKVAYFTGTDTMAATDFTAAGRSLVGGADASAQLTTLGVSTFIKTLLDDADAGTAQTTLGISTFVKTILDDADASTVLSTLGVTTFVKTILDDVDAPAVRTTIGAQASNANLSAIAGLTMAADKVITWTGAGAAATSDITSLARTLIANTTAGGMQTTLGIASFIKTLLDDTDAATAQVTLDVFSTITTTSAGATLTPATTAMRAHYVLSAQAANLTVANNTSTPRDGATIMFRIKDNGTARTLAWGSSYRVMSGVTLPTTTVVGKTHYIGGVYNVADAVYDILGVSVSP